jgi:hypothetical protein
MPNLPQPHGDDAHSLRAGWTIFWVAFAVRVLYMTLAHTYRVRGFDDHFDFGWEAGRIARALTTGYGYADPFATRAVPHTGATAWLPPVYPLLVAATFRLFGVYTAASAWVLLALNCLFSAVTARAIWEIAARCFNLRVARWSAWIWALYPAAMQYAVHWIWETSLTTALFAWVIVLALRMTATQPESEHRRPPKTRSLTRDWLLFALAWAVIALSNSTLLLFLPVCGGWIAVGLRRLGAPGQRIIGNATFAAVIFACCLAPWIGRNWKTFHALIPLRGNFGAELYMGDGPGSNGFLRTYQHPHVDPAQLLLYRQLGEVHYVAVRGAAAKAFIHAHPAHFLAVVAKRLYFFWAGVPSDQRFAAEALRLLSYQFVSLAGLLGLALALRRGIPAAGLFAWAFLLLPITYYFVTVHARFRHPLEPLLCIFGVYLFQSAERRTQGSPNPNT